MSNMTTRLQDQKAIQAALEQFENSKRATIPTEIFEISSQGKIYPKDHPLRSGKIELRYMTAYDEDILTNASYMKEGVTLDKLLEALITTPVKLDEISTIDKNGLILAARIMSYGKMYPVTVKDPATKNLIERNVDLSKIKATEITLEPDENGEFDYALPNGTILKFTLNLNDSVVKETVSKRLTQLIKQVDSSRDVNEILDFIKYKFSALDSKQFQKYVLDHTPILDLSYEFEGEDGGTFTVGFQLGSDLFWF